MSEDPYHAVQQELQSALQSTSQLLTSYLRIRSTAREESEELTLARNELISTLEELETDLEDLEESVKIVESKDASLFGLTDAQVQERRRYVVHVRREIENTKHQLSSSGSSSRARLSPTSPHPLQQPRNGSSTALVSGQDDEEDHQGAWAAQEQQMMIREQDLAIDSISGTLTTLAQQASLMGQEIGEHNELLDDLEQGVDHTDSKLNDAMRRMRKLLRESEKKGSGWCIVFLTIVLILLLLAVILV